MPELPEVENIARDLAPQVSGRRIVTIEKLDWERMVETPSLESFRATLPERSIVTVGRRAKWLLFTLDAGWTLALHLRMSGRIGVQNSDVSPDIYTHLVLALDDGRRIFFHDQRKFGRVRLLNPEGMAALDCSLGLEPLDEHFSTKTLADALTRRRTRLKPLLLDQTCVAGLGNIYVDESLWQSQIHPLRTADSLKHNEIERLHAAIRQVLEQAIYYKGSTLRNYRNGYGQRGENQEHFSVYDRKGKPCPRCGTPVERIVIAQRGTHICPTCQKLEIIQQ